MAVASSVRVRSAVEAAAESHHVARPAAVRAAPDLRQGPLHAVELRLKLVLQMGGRRDLAGGGSCVAGLAGGLSRAVRPGQPRETRLGRQLAVST